MATATQTMLSVNQAADRLGVKHGTVRKLITSGSLPASRIGGAIRIDPSELETWIKSQRIAG